MKVSTWLICWLTSLVPAATFSSTSGFSAAAFLALSVMAAIQPWSAAGAEKPMTTFWPGAALLPPDPAAGALAAGALAVGAGVLPVQPATASRAVQPRAVAARTGRRTALRREPRVGRADMETSFRR
jgi:hypothetical protein